MAHRHPRQTPAALARQICVLRRQRGFGPHRVTRETVRRYERPRPGDLLHIDVKKLSLIPRGGGERFAPGFVATQSRPRSGRSRGIDYLHVAVDDHSRYAYVEALPDERGITAARSSHARPLTLRNVGGNGRGVLTDKAKAYTSGVFTATAAERGIKLSLTRSYRPQTNGRAKRFIRTLQDEWAYIRRYRSNPERLRVLDRWLDHYNRTRPHRGIGGSVPASRL